MAEPDLATQLMLTEPSIAQLDEAAVEGALAGFPLEPVRSVRWISRGIQGATYYSTKFGECPQRPSNSNVRDELTTLAEQVITTVERLRSISDEADSAAWHTAFGQALDTSGTPTHNFLIGTPPGYAAIDQANSQLLNVAALLTAAAERMAGLPQGQKWRQKEDHDRKVALAYYLSPVFEIGYGKTPAPNVWERSDGTPRVGYWPDFYQRIMALAFHEHATPNLIRILKEARKLSQSDGGIYPANLLAE